MTIRYPEMDNPLRHVAFNVQLTELATLVHQRQFYRNQGHEPIEAVYTFPVPLGALLLDATLVTGERELVLQVTPRQQAERDYEDALEERKAAYRIEESRPGLFTLSAGNLMPGQEAELHLRWAMLNRWHQMGLNLRLPTTLTPRYGSDVDAGLGGASTPQHSIFADNRCDVQVHVDAALTQLDWHCASHAFDTDISADGMRLSANGLAMDQDIVIRFHQHQPLPPTLHYLPDGDATLAMVGMQADTRDAHPVTPRDLVLVIDCSGSMAGGSIAQAREAASAVIDQLLPGQRISLIRFGSRVEPLYDQPRPVDDMVRSQLHRFVQSIDANLGGTNMGDALRRAADHAARCPQAADILLLTDGAIYDTEDALRAFAGGSTRVFTIGIGAAPNEEVVGRIATLGQGHCELVGPGEDIVGAVRDQFQRMQSGEPDNIEVHWPAGAQSWSPATQLYRGDAAYLFARCAAGQPSASLSLLTHGERRGRNLRVTASDVPEGISAQVLVRLAAHEHLRQITDPAQRLELAMRYSLLCEQTNLLVIDEHSAKGSDAPQVVPVHHNMPAMMAPAYPSVDHDADFFLESVIDDRVMSSHLSPQGVVFSRRIHVQDEDRGYDDDVLHDASAGFRFDDLDDDVVQSCLRRANQRIARRGLRSLDTGVLDSRLTDALRRELAVWVAEHGQLVTVIAILQVMAGGVATPTLNSQAASHPIPANLLRDVRSALARHAYS